MGNYQAYIVKNGRIMQRLDLNCEDDDAAIERAISLAESCNIELWQNDRMVAGFEAPPGR